MLTKRNQKKRKKLEILTVIGCGPRSSFLSFFDHLTIFVAQKSSIFFLANEYFPGHGPLSRCSRPSIRHLDACLDEAISDRWLEFYVIRSQNVQKLLFHA